MSQWATVAGADGGAGNRAGGTADTPADRPEPDPVAAERGPGYFWVPSQDFSGLPLANFALQLGQHKDGHTP